MATKEAKPPLSNQEHEIVFESDDNKIGKLTSTSTKSDAVEDLTESHKLKNSYPGRSDIELLAQEIENRRENRIEVTFKQRKRFLDICFEVAKKEGGIFSRLSKSGLEGLVKEFQERVSKKENISSSGVYKLSNRLLNLIGVWDMDEAMLKLFTAGLEYVQRDDEDEFYFRDFNFYCLKIRSRFSFLRIPQLAVFFWMLIYYFGSAILFCSIMKNENVCPKDTPYAFGGWITSVYFASVTMSTVGYGGKNAYSIVACGKELWLPRRLTNPLFHVPSSNDRCLLNWRTCMAVICRYWLYDHQYYGRCDSLQCSC
jgi:cellulose synthase/poly-beta-1,6-N-acetylglucosamine synthase-like glycosyltransferase